MYNKNMYIFELIAKIIKNKKNPKTSRSTTIPEEIDYNDACEHTFFPIDSTNEILACIKCGLIIKNDDSNKKKNNPFKYK